MSKPSAFAAFTAEQLEAACDERYAVDFFMDGWAAGDWKAAMPWSDPTTDRPVREFPMKYGRADILMFHLDGSATVIEAKDGRYGYQHVASAIGQVSLYATQLAKLGTVKVVRRAVLWSALKDDATETLMKEVCLHAGVTPLPVGPLRQQLRVLKGNQTLMAMWEKVGLSREQRIERLAGAFLDACRSEVLARAFAELWLNSMMDDAP